MPTEALFQNDAYRKTLSVIVTHVRDEEDQRGFVTDKTIFYAAGGGQPGDKGHFEGGAIIDTRKSDEGGILHLVASNVALPKVGDAVELVLDWDQRLLHMRMHTALHLLCAVVGAPVTGGSIGSNKSRLDFDLEQNPDKAELTEKLNAEIAKDLAVSTSQISDAELDANPDLVRTMSVKPPRGSGFIRMVRIGAVEDSLDYQPCGGTHVRSTAEIGKVRVSKIEKKGKMNRRIAIVLDEDSHAT